MVENITAKSADSIIREPFELKGSSFVLAYVKDPDGYIFELIQRAPTPQPLCHVMLRVADLQRSINFYEKVKRISPHNCWKKSRETFFCSATKNSHPEL